MSIAQSTTLRGAPRPPARHAAAAEPATGGGTLMRLSLPVYGNGASRVLVKNAQTTAAPPG